MFSNPDRRSLRAHYPTPVSDPGLAGGQALAQKAGAGRFYQV